MTAGEPQETATLSLDEAVDFAITLHRADQVEAATKLYERILEVAPETPEALHFYGVLKHQTGAGDEAVSLIERAIRLRPDHLAMRNNLGNVLLQRHRYAEAAASYRAALALDPDFVEALGNLGAALRKLGEAEESERCYRRALALDPDHREAHENLGRLLSHQGRMDEAIAAFTRALELEPYNAETRRLLVSTYVAGRRFDRAMELLDEWLVDQPASPTAIHLKAAISGENVPARAPDSYVETMFDRFAPSFDLNLAKLEYRAPELVAAALARALRPPRGDLAILDAGCGTGLCGPLLRPYADRLLGIDLSGKMLDHAGQRGGYDRLVRAELVAFMEAAPEAFDAIVSADTLCYFGSLAGAAEAAAGALRPGGLLVFTVEASDGPEPFRLNPNGRYSHRADHVREAAEAAGLAIVEILPDRLRMERGNPVEGLVAVARRPGPPTPS